jgi:hypothetical protein
VLVSPPPGILEMRMASAELSFYEHQNNRNYLLKVLLAYAPTGNAQRKCATLMNRAIADGVKSLVEIELMMAQWLADGLRDGIWPWTEPPKVPTQG